ncbi:MAG: HK97 gp10 family phage protein [Defluviitaleaceae bacterium]|nr:HK97 gp10 family phage protein [Defluviitaleaceae bacterium]
MNLQDLSNQLDSLHKGFDGVKRSFNERRGSRFIEHAIPRTPVDTGLSRNSWHKEVSSEKVRIYNDAARGGADSYASHWNYGTSRGIIGTQTMEKAQNLTAQEEGDIFSEEIGKAWVDAQK